MKDFRLLPKEPVEDPGRAFRNDDLPSLRPKAPLDSWNIRLYTWTRNLSLLVAISTSILLVSIVVAWLVREKPDSESKAPGFGSRQSMAEILSRGDAGFDLLCTELLREGFTATREGAQSVVDLIQRSPLSNANKDAATSFWLSLTSHTGEPNATLLILAHQPAPAAKTNQLVADLYLSAKNVAKGRQYLERELRWHDTEELRNRILRIALSREDTEWLRMLCADPRFANLIPEGERLRIAILDKDWSRIVPGVFRLELRSATGAAVFLALITGIVWIAVLVQASQPEKPICFRTLIIAPALLAGAISTFPTLLVGIWQEAAWGLTRTGSFLQNLEFFILGVGLREESIKLLFFVPFLPLLLLRKSSLEAMIVASCVGLGFAIQEDLQYIHLGGGLTALTRVLTANVFHLTATGLIGYSLFESIRNPVRVWIFPLVFCVVALGHGIYDVFAFLPPIPKVMVFVMAIFLVQAMFYFRRLRTLRTNATDQFSMGATVVLGIALVAGASFIVASHQIGFVNAASVLAFQILAYVMTGYLFHWQLGEGMSHAYAEEAQAWKPY